MYLFLFKEHLIQFMEGKNNKIRQGDITIMIIVILLNYLVWVGNEIIIFMIFFLFICINKKKN